MSIQVRETVKGRRYDVKLRGPDGTQYSKTFRTRKDATKYEAQQVTALAGGVYVSPQAGSTTLGAVAERWLDSGTKRDTTMDRNEGIVYNHILPGFGPGRAVRSLTKADCQNLIDTWTANGQAPRTVQRQYATLRAMMQYAVDAALVLRNPASRLRIPPPDEVVRPTLTPEQLERLADELGQVQGLFMWCGAVLGLRWAETAGLTVSSIDMLGGTISIRAQINRDGVLAPPKTKGSIRTLAAPAWLLDDLVRLMRDRELTSADGDKLVFASEADTGLSYTNWRVRVWKPATEAAGVPGLRYHDLRSITATALVATGVDLRTAMHRLGHTTPAMTLAVYARVALDRDREAADAVASRVAPGKGREGRN